MLKKTENLNEQSKTALYNFVHAGLLTTAITTHVGMALTALTGSWASAALSCVVSLGAAFSSNFIDQEGDYTSTKNNYDTAQDVGGIVGAFAAVAICMAVYSPLFDKEENTSDKLNSSFSSPSFNTASSLYNKYHNLVVFKHS